ncbi:ArsA family ATPase [Silvanigrella sp.]|jgi:anion-transporting  ArsA/GET3 family ATPase|uniref:ArsA family ATPase n=1 Tax=Silvanigrella sp. TaxID=2024976 RepID=UPI0037C6A8C4
MANVFPKLHIFLGAGGVGKTTLSASFALSLASSGKKVGLISIDPAKRLQTALGVGVISESGTLIPLNNSKGELRAAILHIGESLVRWVDEKGMSPEKRENLFKNPYFAALSSKMASAVDTLAAIRVAEWLEQYPDTEELVIDTAPGIHAIDFIAKPEKVSSFLDSKIIDWIKWFVGGAHEKQNFVARAFKTGARKVLDGLALVGGRNFIINFGEFLIMLDEVFITALERLKYSQKWLKHSSTNIVLVTSIREDAISVAKEINRVLTQLGLPPKLAVINRTFPIHLKNEEYLKLFMNKNDFMNSNEKLFANYLASYFATQLKVHEQLSSSSLTIVEIPIAASLDGEQDLRLSDLSSLGDIIRSKTGKNTR